MALWFSQNDHQCHKRKIGSEKYDKSRVYNSLLECDAVSNRVFKWISLKREKPPIMVNSRPIGVVEREALILL
jgi:hypothetical protein